MKALIIIFLIVTIFGGAAYTVYRLFVVPQQELKAEKLAPPTPTPPDLTIPEFNKCVALRRSNKLIEARAAFTTFTEHYPDSSKIEEARNMLGDINSTIFLSAIPAPEKEVYIVQKGDVINRVAARMKTTGELIMKSNNMSGSMLRIGQRITVSPSDFSLLISHKLDKVIVLNKGKFFKQYPILSWPPAHAKKPLPKGVPLPKVQGKVTDKIAWAGGTRVTVFDKNFREATFWIVTSIPNCTLHGEAEESTHKPVGNGIRLPPEALAELGFMLTKGDPVTLE